MIFQFNRPITTGYLACSVIFTMMYIFPVSAEENQLPVKAAQASKQSTLEPIERVLALIDERLKLIPDVAKYKWNTHGKIEDLRREREIISALGQKAGLLGLPIAWTEQFFRAQIESSKNIQRELFERWQSKKMRFFNDAPDLVKVTRPKLDALTTQLLDALVLAWPMLQNPAYLSEIQVLIAKKLDTKTYSRLTANMASAPLILYETGH